MLVFLWVFLSEIELGSMFGFLMVLVLPLMCLSVYLLVFLMVKVLLVLVYLDKLL